VENDSQYMARKWREIALLDSCLGAPLAPAVPRSAAEAIDAKFKLAAALRAERAVQSWPLTETAHPTIAHWHSGAFKFSFGYQRADLTICGPPIYPPLVSRITPAQTVYTAAGMSAIASVLTAALQVRARASVFLPRGVYSETRELLERFGDRVVIETWDRVSRRGRRAISILWIDSCVASGVNDFRAMPADAFDMVVLDTTCFSHGSRRIVHVVDWAQAAHLPVALVRSHAKLDCLGVEYGRLGSIGYVWDKRNRRHVWMKRLLAETREAIRLFGTAALPSNFPPFVGNPAYDVCTAQRTAAILRNTRRAARRLARACGEDAVGTYQHNLYLTLKPRARRTAAAIWRAADELCELLSQQTLPVKHAGSFGFDFTALDSFVDPISARPVLRIACGDLPTGTVDRIVDAIADYWVSNESANNVDHSRSRAPSRTTVASAAASRAPG